MYQGHHHPLEVPHLHGSRCHHRAEAHVDAQDVGDLETFAFEVVYLDHNATTPVRPEVVEAMARAAVDCPGNPSSVHAWGRRARDAVERARAQVAAFVGVSREEIVFTSGGTEGDNLAIRGLAVGARARGRRHIITSPIEHPAVLGAVSALVAEVTDAPPPRVTLLPVSARGEVALADLEAALCDDTALVTLSLANHELGNRYPIGRFAAAARGRGALVHTDAVQAAGKIPLDLTELGVDAATISAHKMGGPKGVGAVFIRRGLDLPPLLAGGHQERERRPGTENVAGIVGFGVACDLARAALAGTGSTCTAERMEALRRDLLGTLTAIPGTRILGFGDGVDGSLPDAVAEQRISGTVMVAFSGAPGQLVAIGLDLDGVCVSTGAACTSGSLEPSPVLRALGLGIDEASEGVRISLGWTTTAADIRRLGEVLPGIVARVRAAVTAPATIGHAQGGRS
ncbi:MAG: cysteine desulfurase [Deltaproteobacteria bacterium]|nr:cysteine desulfurase [Deltaproteobacteria bacterium]